MANLIKVVETYRIDSQDEADKFIQQVRNDRRFEVTKCSSSKKEIKKQGEVIEDWIHLEVTKVFDDEKSPINRAIVNYNVGDETE